MVAAHRGTRHVEQHDPGSSGDGHEEVAAGVRVTDVHLVMAFDLPATDTTVEFIDQGTTTKLVSRSKYATAEALKTVTDMGMLQGVAETWDWLEERIQAVTSR